MSDNGKEKYTEVASCCFSRDDMKEVARAARRRGMTVSAFMRYSVKAQVVVDRKASAPEINLYPGNERLKL